MCGYMTTQSASSGSKIIELLPLTWLDVLEIQQFFVTILYLWVARQLYVLIKPLIKKGVKGAKALGYLMAVFALCSVTGYFSKIIGVSIEISVLLHGVLILFTLLYIFSGQAVILVNAFKDD